MWMSSLFWNSQSFVSIATTKGKEQILFHSIAWWGLRFQCACSTLKYVTALFRQILTDAERKTMDISVVVNCTKKRLETVELITTQCRQNKLFFLLRRHKLEYWSNLLWNMSLPFLVVCWIFIEAEVNSTAYSRNNLRLTCLSIKRKLLVELVF